MNRSLIFILLLISSTVFAQNSYERYVDEANRMYIKGDYEGAFTLINNYLFITETEDVSEKGILLGEGIYYFYIRLLLTKDQFIGIDYIEKALKENSALVSNRVIEVFNRLKKSEDGVETEILSLEVIGNEDTQVTIDHSTDYTRDELTLLIKKSLLAGKNSGGRKQTNTHLSVFLVIFVSLILLSIFILIILLVKSAKHSDKHTKFTPVLIGHVPVSSEEFDNLLDMCKNYGEKIDRVTCRKNNCINSAELVYKISIECGYSDRDALIFFSASLVYDIGLLDIDEQILKSVHVTDFEFDIIKEHIRPRQVYMSFIPDKFRKVFREAMTMHHENLDGSGYPLGLSGEDIPYLPRVIRVVESYLSQTSSREYKTISDKETALEHLKKESRIYDSNIVEVLDRVI